MPADREFPRLSGAELVTRFGDDEAALRRYRMLVALVREGRSAGEVARTFGVSRESLRRLRQAFQRDGLNALQSRKRGGGHFARGSPLARTISQELAADPGISASVLWRRVRARLLDEGLDAPRSTFYRLLGRLRDDTSASGKLAMGLLRDALAALAEEPPLTLGRGKLAALLLPEEREPLRRGRWLQAALRGSIERLRPSEAGPVLDDPRWRHYLILAGEYVAGEERAALHGALALSASTYSRAKREALERLLALLPIVLDELPPPAPPADLIVPPPAPAAFDREAELEQYMAQLRRSGQAFIWGPEGVGKRDLAAALTARLQARGQKVVWHACNPPGAEGNSGARLLLTLAAALALEGHPALWDGMTSTNAGSTTRQLGLLAELLADRRWTIAVVNTHWLIGHDAARVLDVLTDAQERRNIRLVLVGRQLPAWADPERWPALPSPDDAAGRRAFLAHFANQPGAAYASQGVPLATLRQRAIELVASIPLDTISALEPEEIGRIVADLRPIEELTAELRALLQLRSQ